MAAKGGLTDLADTEANLAHARNAEHGRNPRAGGGVLRVRRQRIGGSAQRGDVADQFDRQCARAFGGGDTQQRAAFKIDGAGGLERRDHRDHAKRQQRHDQDQKHLDAGGQAHRIAGGYRLGHG